MHIRSDSLRSAYHRVKAAAIVNTIQQVVKEPHDPGKVIDPPEADSIGGIPGSRQNVTDTDEAVPTEHNLPKDPEFDTDQIIAGTGSGPSMETSRDYN